MDFGKVRIHIFCMDSFFYGVKKYTGQYLRYYRHVQSDLFYTHACYFPALKFNAKGNRQSVFGGYGIVPCKPQDLWQQGALQHATNLAAFSVLFFECHIGYT